MLFDIQTYNPFEINSENDFNEIALQIFHFQYRNNKIYKQYVDGLNSNTPSAIEEIPFLPIEFFKLKEVVAAEHPFATTFKSSGTSGMVRSQHFVKDLELYETSFTNGIQLAYPDYEERVILALLPNYLEQGDSSLVYMMSKLIENNPNLESGFYLDNLNELRSKLVELDKAGRKVLLIGVSYALLDLIEIEVFDLKNTIVVETGGMKGRRKEMIKSELHEVFKKGFGVDQIHSEYGMTELLSQAYSKGEQLFQCPPWMKIQIRDVNDPLQIVEQGKAGGINVIDLANIYSCSFIATQDLGKIHENGKFEVIGRFDNSDVRGCNLMVV